MAAIVALKKFAMASAIAVSGGYTGAIIYGSNDERTRNLFEQSIPGYYYGLDAYKALKDNGIKILSKLRQSPQSDNTLSKNSKSLLDNNREKPLLPITTPEPSFQDKHLAQLREIQEKYDSELKVLKGKLEREQEESLFKDLTRKEELESAIMAVKAELEVKLMIEVERALESERKLRAFKQKELLERIEEVEGRSLRLLQKYHEALHSDNASRTLECLNVITANGNEIHSKEVVLKYLKSIKQSNNDEELTRILCESLIRSVERIPEKYLTRANLKDDLVRIGPIAKTFADFNNQTWSYLYPTIGKFFHYTKSILKGPSSAQVYTEKSLTLMEESLQRGDLETALRVANRIEGWPRIFLKDWIESCRLVLEFERGLNVLKCHLLSLRLP